MRQLLSGFLAAVIGTCASVPQAIPQSSGRASAGPTMLAPAQGHPATLKSFTVQDDVGQVRVLVNVDFPVRCRPGILRNPARIYFDLQDTRPASSVARQQILASKPEMVRRVRVGVPGPGVTRLVLDLARPVSYSVENPGPEGTILITIQAAELAPAQGTVGPPRLATRVKIPEIEVLPELGGPPNAPSSSRSLGFDPASAPTDPDAAFHWYLKYAKTGVAAAQFALGNIYVQGHGTSKDPRKAASWYRRAAEQGHAGAQANLGFSYVQGWGVKRDDAEAVKWFRASAAQGDVRGAYNLGASYVHGRGVPRNYTVAAKWLRAAADRGFTEAQYALGTLYATGLGVPQNRAEARALLQPAAEAGSARAQLALGQTYLAEADTAQHALVWIERAARQGLPDAQLALARMFRDGAGVLPSGPDATNWFRQAALQGTAEAQYSLGEMYRGGDLVARDPVLAYAWFALAGSNGHPGALKALNAMAPSMTMTQIAAAQQQALTFAAELSRNKTLAKPN